MKEMKEYVYFKVLFYNLSNKKTNEKQTKSRLVRFVTTRPIQLFIQFDFFEGGTLINREKINIFLSLVIIH